MTDDIEALKAQLAQAEALAAEAEAKAARARADAARAALEALSASSAVPAPAEADTQQPAGNTLPLQEDTAAPQVDTAVPTPDPTASHAVPEAAAPASQTAPQADVTALQADAPAPQTTPQAPLSEFAQMIADGYSFDAPSIVLGTLLDSGVTVPAVRTKMPLAVFNRHSLVAGATGTGKTRTLQLLAEGLSAAGAAVALCDVKGDLTGLAEAGSPSPKLIERTQTNGQPWQAAAFPVELLSLGGAQVQFNGIPVRARITDFGPILLARALSLNTTQEQCLQLIFSWADEHGLDLVDAGDLRTVITYLTGEDGKEELAKIGGVSKATAGVILRALTALEAQGGDEFFGEPSFDTADLLRKANDGRGVISLLGVGDIQSRPALVSAVIMWLLADLFASLPEVGDVEVPKLVFFFDEAHLLFADATKEFTRTVVQTVRLIRSKGVGIVFVTQTPKDIPADVLAQLGSRIQHGLRAITPEDQTKLEQSVRTFPHTPLPLDEVLTTLGTGEAIVTVLGPKGQPTPVAPTRLWAPASVMGPAAPDIVSSIASSSALAERYRDAVNPESATEILTGRIEEAQQIRAEAEQAALEAKEAERLAKEEARQRERDERAAAKEAEREARAAERAAEREAAAARKAAEKRTSLFEKALTSAVRSASSQLGRQITRSIFGNRR
nr:helicase HerA-like domain-containing protein [Schaalia suimastitidis]